MRAVRLVFHCVGHMRLLQLLWVGLGLGLAELFNARDGNYRQ